MNSSSSPPPPSRRLAVFRPIDLAILLVLGALGVALLWPLPLHPASTLPDLGDPLDSAWRLTWPVHQALHDPRHLLDANIFYPVRTTYLFDELILGVAVLVAPVTLLGGSGVLAFNVALLLAFIGNGWAMYALGRHLTGSRWAALAGAVVFAAAPFRFQHVGHLGLSSAYWMPLALLFLDRLLLAPTWPRALLFGACVALQALSAQYYGFQIAIVTALYLLYALFWRRDYLQRGAFVLRLLAATLFAEVLLLPIVAPYTSVKGTWGYSRGLAENELYSATLSSFLAAPAANSLGAWLAGAARHALGVTGWSIWLYPGLGAVVVALLGLARARRVAGMADAPRDLYPFMAGLALFGAAMALGPVLYPQTIGQQPLTRLMPYRFVFTIIPFFDALRAPERFGNVMLLGLAGMVSFGVAGLLARLPGAIRRRAVWRALAGFGLVALVGAEYLRAPLTVATVPPAPPVYRWLAAQPRGVTLELPLDVPATQLNREQLRQYWSTLHWQPRVNGSSDIRPLVYDRLRHDLAAFPDPRTLGILQGLGVRYVIVHRAELPAPGWSALAPRYAAYRTTLRPRGAFGDDLVFELRPDTRFATLRALIPAGASVFLSAADPVGTDTYMATIGYLLRDHPLVTLLVPTFGQRYRRPRGGQPAEYAVLYRGEDPARYNYPPGLPVLYEDDVVRVYRGPRR